MVDAAGGFDPLKPEITRSEEPPPPPPPPPSSSPVKKRRGRPRKSDTNGAATPAPVRRYRKRKIEPISPPQVDGSLVGQSVHGVLDGSFDAGYILTVRVGETDTILRGVVFGPGLCVPITKANDIAPNVRFAGSSRATGIFPPTATVGAAAAAAAAEAGTTTSVGASRLSSPVLASSATPSSSQALAVTAAENPMAFVDVSSSRHHTPVVEQQQQQQQQFGFAAMVTPMFGIGSSTAELVGPGKLPQLPGHQQQQKQQQQDPAAQLGCSLQLANGSAPQREQQHHLQQQQSTQAETLIAKDGPKDTLDRPSMA